MYRKGGSKRVNLSWEIQLIFLTAEIALPNGEGNRKGRLPLGGK